MKNLKIFCLALLCLGLGNSSIFAQSSTDLVINTSYQLDKVIFNIANPTSSTIIADYTIKQNIIIQDVILREGSIQIAPGQQIELVATLSDLTLQGAFIEFNSSSTADIFILESRSSIVVENFGNSVFFIKFCPSQSHNAIIFHWSNSIHTAEQIVSYNQLVDITYCS